MTLSVNAPLVVSKEESNGRKIVIIGAFFFIFGFVTWINGTLIPYLRIACELEEWQAYLVTFAFYISYTIMALPSGKLLQRTGMVKGMSMGLVIMAAGCLVFIPAALTRMYSLFLLGLFFVGTGLTILQSAVNPYVTLLGSQGSAAKRISIMGICNKVAGILAPLVVGSIILKNSDGLIAELASLSPAAKQLRLDQLSRTVIFPYVSLTIILLLIAMAIRYAHLPEITSEVEEEEKHDNITDKKSGVQMQYLLGFIAIFCCVGTEVLAGDTIGNYGLFHGLGLDTAKNLASFTLAGMMIGYIGGVLGIPKLISQQKAFYYSSLLGLLITLAIIFVPGKASIICLAVLGLANALLWPAIWPQALSGLKGKQLNKGSAILIMGIAGGALLPLGYGWLAKYFNNQNAYWILFPVYLFLLFYSVKGKRQMVTEAV
ncbi:sugar MFS transporter [Flavisolibacter tropicus]|uniref:Major facilitator transporter n=1 Tax=Flavisolibacter tropicus TaxID=1492898 RepID=A0A172TXL6_9BACT|nr:sugar MFS transporter [Flavisolibacter tropicus]ANE51477.1 major facilitator transporter [Flavisolibacter tropicus]